MDLTTTHDADQSAASTHPFHKHHPSVPLSTHSSSTRSDALEGFISPPSTYQLGATRRYSKFTFSSSGGSSIYSDTSLGRREAQAFPSAGPDISTVFEEEGSLDVDLHGTSHEPRLLNPPNLTPPENYEHRDFTQFRYPNISTTPGSLSNAPPHRHERAGTITTVSSNHSGKSAKSQHPFASAVVRPSSPPPLPALRPAVFLSPQPDIHATQLPPQRSHPNLHPDLARMNSAPPHLVTFSTADKDSGETCPVCVESLSATYRLPGEQPPIVPECGHALHEVGHKRPRRSHCS